MSDVGAKVAADNDVPKWRVLSVQLFLDPVGHVLLSVESVHGCLGQFHHFSLEHLIHVCILDLHLHWINTSDCFLALCKFAKEINSRINKHSFSIQCIHLKDHFILCSLDFWTENSSWPSFRWPSKLNFRVAPTIQIGIDLPINLFELKSNAALLEVMQAT